MAQTAAGGIPYLEATVRTGTFCSYVPDPRAPVAWRVEGSSET